MFYVSWWWSCASIAMMIWWCIYFAKSPRIHRWNISSIFYPGLGSWVAPPFYRSFPYQTLWQCSDGRVECKGVMKKSRFFKSGDDDRDELRSGWGGESRQEWWGWRNESGHNVYVIELLVNEESQSEQRNSWRYWVCFIFAAVANSLRQQLGKYTRRHSFSEHLTKRSLEVSS